MRPCRTGIPRARPGGARGIIGGMDVTLHLSQDPEADELLGRSALAALVGMLLDQQVPMEWAFKGPRTIADRLGADDLDAHDIAAQDPDAFVALLSEKPAVHRYPGSMAKRIQQLCQYLVERYDGDAELVWKGVDDGRELLRRLEDLPGFGKQKAQIFVALLGKQLGVHPEGWREAAGGYGEDELVRASAYRVYEDPADLLRHIDEVGGRR